MILILFLALYHNHIHILLLFCLYLFFVLLENFFYVSLKWVWIYKWLVNICTFLLNICKFLLILSLNIIVFWNSMNHIQKLLYMLYWCALDWWPFDPWLVGIVSMVMDAHAVYHVPEVGHSKPTVLLQNALSDVTSSWMSRMCCLMNWMQLPMYWMTLPMYQMLVLRYFFGLKSWSQPERAVFQHSLRCVKFHS